MSKVRKAMASSQQHPIVGSCEVDEIMIGGHRTGKPGRWSKKQEKGISCSGERLSRRDSPGVRGEDREFFNSTTGYLQVAY